MQEKTHTRYFEAQKEPEQKVLDIIDTVYLALTEKGYNPVSQIVGYIMSGDPGYISSHKDARTKMTSIERSTVIEVLLRSYVSKL